MKKLIKILLTVSMLFTCFGVNVFADDTPADVEFTSDGNGTTNVININVEYNNVIIDEGAVVTLGEASNFVVHGEFTNKGNLQPTNGAHIVFDDVTKANGQITIYDHWGNVFEEQPSGFMEFEYVVDKWMQFFASPVFESSNNGSEINKIDGFVEYVNVTIQEGAVVVITEGSALVIHGTFTNSGTISPDAGAHIVFDDVSQAKNNIDIYDSEGKPFGETLTGFKEFEFDGNIWKEFVPPTEVIYAISYDTEAGEVWHYEGDDFVKVDPSTEPYEYNVTGEDKIYILENSGWMFDHIEAEGDEFDHPENSIINKDDLPNETIDSVTYKVVRVTPNPKDNNFYYFEVRFVKDPNLRFVEELNTLELAFDSTTGEANNNAKLKEYIAHSIYSRYLEQGSRYRIENTVFADCDFNDFKGKVKIITEGTPTKTPVEIDGNASTYFLFELDGLDNFIGIVYKLSGTDEFILRDGNTYTVIDVSEEAKLASEGQGAAALKDFKAVQGGKIVVREVNNTVNREESETGPNYEIFGNYAGFPMNYTGFMQDYQDTRYISIERVWACAPESIDISAFSSLNCEMILYSKNFLGVCIKSDENAQPWSSDNLPIYPTNSGSEEATVFYASSEVEILTPYGAPSGSTISSITFADGSTSWNDCSISNNVVTFGSIFYDKVPLKITYTNGTSKTFTIARTGISIGDYPAPGGSNSVDVCGVTVNFTDDNKWLIAAPFYYANTSPGASDRVSLFVKITDNSGNVSTKLVSSPLNNSIKDDGSNDTYSKYDVFELWRGKESERPQKIEVIAFVNGDAENFGGVKLGSGNGVKWTKERGRK